MPPFFTIFLSNLRTPDAHRGLTPTPTPPPTPILPKANRPFLCSLELGLACSFGMALRLFLEPRPPEGN